MVANQVIAGFQDFVIFANTFLNGDHMSPNPVYSSMHLDKNELTTFPLLDLIKLDETYPPLDSMSTVRTFLTSTSFHYLTRPLVFLPLFDPVCEQGISGPQEISRSVQGEARSGNEDGMKLAGGQSDAKADYWVEFFEQIHQEDVLNEKNWEEFKDRIKNWDLLREKNSEISQISKSSLHDNPRSRKAQLRTFRTTADDNTQEPPQRDRLRCMVEPNYVLKFYSQSFETITYSNQSAGLVVFNLIWVSLFLFVIVF
jgi:hypothetical protein